ncbi:MAG: hypothetical protein JO227_01180 [Acetobacteraceae bacterium]|nr:hypothetical protein [Acetobacteraceae bacterium]
MPSAAMRALLGFAAGAISVLVFHQGIVELLHFLASGPRAWSVQPVPPFGIPRIADLCFWGGVWGIPFGMLSSRLRGPLWLWGIPLGLAAVLTAWFVVAPIKGLPVAGGWVLSNMGRGLLINVPWGIGVGLILPLLMPRKLPRPAPTG